MDMHDAIDQLKSLIDDRASFLSGEPEHDDILVKDIVALRMAIKAMQEQVAPESPASPPDARGGINDRAGGENAPEATQEPVEG